MPTVNTSEFTMTTLKKEIDIKYLITFYYFEFDKKYQFTGQQYDFWELIYVDSGDIFIDVSGKPGVPRIKLNQGEIVFHKPGEFHSHHADGQHHVNMLVITFVCHSKAMRHFYGKIFKLNEYQVSLLAKTVQEAKATFLRPLHEVVDNKLLRRPNPPFASEQLIKQYLELLFIDLIRTDLQNSMVEQHRSLFKSAVDDEKIKRILQFMRDNLYGELHIEDICRHCSLSPTNIKNLFHRVMGVPIMSYYRQLKIEEAKNLIRCGENSMSEIAEKLSYSSVQYFSTHFKAVTGMSPSEYSRSVKARSVT